MLVIFYLSGVEQYIIDIFKKNYKSAKHIIIDSVFHNIDQENILNPKLSDLLRAELALSNLKEVYNYFVIQSFKSANNHFMELMNLLLQINAYNKESTNKNNNSNDCKITSINDNSGGDVSGGKIKPYVFLLYMAYGHRCGGIKDFMLENINKYSHKIITLDINKPHHLVENITLQDVLYNEFMELKKLKKLSSLADSKCSDRNCFACSCPDHNLLVAIDYRSLKVVKDTAQKTGLPYLFLNKHNTSVSTYYDSLSWKSPKNIIYNMLDKCDKNNAELCSSKDKLNLYIIDDVLYTGTSIISAMNKINMILDMLITDDPFQGIQRKIVTVNSRKVEGINLENINVVNINLYVTHKLQQLLTLATLDVGRRNLNKEHNKKQNKEQKYVQNQYLIKKDSQENPQEIRVNLQQYVLNNHAYEEGDKEISWNYVFKILDKYFGQHFGK